MSNIIKAINYLKAAPDKRFLIITHDNNNVGPAEIYLKDIPNEDLAAYLKFILGSADHDRLVWVECRKMQGATHVKADGFTVTISANIAAPQAPTPVVQNAQVIEPISQTQLLGNPGAGSQIFGLGFAEVMNMQRNTDRLADLKEVLDETKAELKAVKHEKNLLEIDHRSAITKLATAEAQKEMAVLLVKNENRSIFDSPAFEKLMDKAPDMLEKYAAMKGGNFQEVTGQLGNPNFSETKSSFVELLDDFTDNEVNFLGAIAHFRNNPNFIQEISLTLKKYQNA